MHQRGFTLIELLLVLAAGTAALTLSMQTFKQLSERGLLIHPMAKISEALRFARAMAIGSRRSISLCPSKDGYSCTDSTGYEQGWIIFADDDNLGRRDPDEPLLTTEGAFSRRITLRSNTFATFISFHADGRASTNGNFVACADGHPDNAMGIFVIRSGRLRKTPADAIEQCFST